MKTLREQSFQVHGPQLFNSLPKQIRNLTKITIDEFKEKIDKFLEDVPDQPHVEGLIPVGCNMFTAAPSNSILDQARNKRRPGA